MQILCWMLFTCIHNFKLFYTIIPVLTDVQWFTGQKEGEHFTMKVNKVQFCFSSVVMTYPSWFSWTAAILVKRKLSRSVGQRVPADVTWCCRWHFLVAKITGRSENQWFTEALFSQGQLATLMWENSQAVCAERSNYFTSPTQTAECSLVQSPFL